MSSVVTKRARTKLFFSCVLGEETKRVKKKWKWTEMSEKNLRVLTLYQGVLIFPLKDTKSDWIKTIQTNFNLCRFAQRGKFIFWKRISILMYKSFSLLFVLILLSFHSLFLFFLSPNTQLQKKVLSPLITILLK